MKYKLPNYRFLTFLTLPSENSSATVARYRHKMGQKELEHTNYRQQIFQKVQTTIIATMTAMDIFSVHQEAAAF
jgi:hypothetical protein